MARIRSINPCQPKDEDVASLSMAARYVFAFLPCHADREGRLKDSAFTLKAEILPGDAVDMEAILAELAAARHIIRYQVDGRRFIQIRNFQRHQNPHKNEIASVIPAPDGTPVQPDETWVYFVRNTRSGDIKIGSSRMVEARLTDLQIGTTDRLALIGVMKGGVEKERELHGRFQSQRLNGEWFASSQQLLDFIEAETLTELPESSRKTPGKDGTAPADPDQGSGSGSPSLLSKHSDQTRPESDDRAKPLTGYSLQQTFARIRSEVIGGIAWQSVNVAGGKASTMAELVEQAGARADVEPTIRMLFADAKAGKAGNKSAEILRDGSFAFGAWCSQWTALRERLHSKAPAIPIAAARASGGAEPAYRKL